MGVITQFHSKSQFIFPTYYIPQSTINKFIFFIVKRHLFGSISFRKILASTIPLITGPHQIRRTAFDLRVCRRFTITSITALRKCGKWRQNEQILCLIFWNILIFWLFWCKIRCSGALVSSFLSLAQLIQGEHIPLRYPLNDLDHI